MANAEYLSKLNEWHLELAIAVKALDKVLWEIDDDAYGAIGHVLRHRLLELVETCPFPTSEGGEASAQPGPSAPAFPGGKVVLN